MIPDNFFIYIKKIYCKQKLFLFFTKTFLVLRFSFTSLIHLKNEQSGGLDIILGEVTKFSKVTAEW